MVKQCNESGKQYMNQMTDSTEIEIIKQNQRKILKLSYTMNEMKKSIQGEEKNQWLEDRSCETNQSEKKKKERKRLKKESQCRL